MFRGLKREISKGEKETRFDTVTDRCSVGVWDCYGGEVSEVRKNRYRKDGGVRQAYNIRRIRRVKIGMAAENRRRNNTERKNKEGNENRIDGK